jgi:DNA-binding CsgD family transcriptional regulator
MRHCVFTRAEVAAMLRLVDAPGGLPEGMSSSVRFLTGVCTLIRADCGERSDWRRQTDGHWICTHRDCCTLRGGHAPEAILPTSEQPTSLGDGEDAVRTWVAEGTLGWDGAVLFSLRFGDGVAHLFVFRRPPGRREFSSRDVTMVDALVRCNRVVGGFRGDVPQPVGDALSKRLREVLDALLEGRSEKQIAHVLGISANTVHVYVKNLHKHFGVTSRGELMSLWIRRPHSFETDPSGPFALSLEAVG